MCREVTVHYWFPWQPNKSRALGRNKAFATELSTKEPFQWVGHVFFSGPRRLNCQNWTIFGDFTAIEYSIKDQS